MIELLPIWNYPDSTPAFYDKESLTSIQAAAKVYGKMNEIVAEYNAFATEWNKKLEEFEYVTVEEYHEFELSMRQELQDFIDTIDIKISDFEGDISTMENSVEWVKEQITSINQSIAIYRIDISDLNASIRNLDERITSLESNPATPSGSSSKLYLHRVRFQTIFNEETWMEDPSFDFYVYFYRTSDTPIVSLADIQPYEMHLEKPFDFTEYDAPEAQHYAVGVFQHSNTYASLLLGISYVADATGWEQGSHGGETYIAQEKFNIYDTVYEV